MRRTFLKSMVAVGVAVGMLWSSSGVAFPARAPRAAHQRKPLRAVVLVDQGKLLAQGLSPKAALKKARHYLPYSLTTAHYLPRGFQLIELQVLPFIQGIQVPQDTQTFMNLAALAGARRHHAKVTQAPVFEIDHQAAQPYVYEPTAYFTISTARLGRRKVTVAEQKYHDYAKHKAVDLLYVYWYDSRARVATEVTADLVTAHLSRSQIFKIAASVR